MKKIIVTISMMVLMMVCFTGCKAGISPTIEFNPDGSGTLTVSVSGSEAAEAAYGKTVEEVTAAGFEDGTVTYREGRNEGIWCTVATYVYNFKDLADLEAKLDSNEILRGLCPFEMEQLTVDGKNVIRVSGNTVCDDDIISYAASRFGEDCIPYHVVGGVECYDYFTFGRMFSTITWFNIKDSYTIYEGIDPAYVIDERDWDFIDYNYSISIDTTHVTALNPEGTKYSPASYYYCFDIILGDASPEVVEEYQNSIGMHNFKKLYNYNNSFSDVSTSDWYYDSVKFAYEYGIMNGTSNTTFNPDGFVTYAELAAIASRIHAQYYAKEINTFDGADWWSCYELYAKNNQLIALGDHVNNSPSSRGNATYYLHKVIGTTDMPSVREWAAFDDVHAGDEYYQPIKTLYCAGIIEGMGNNQFSTYGTLTRAQVCTIIYRILCPGARISG